MTKDKCSKLKYYLNLLYAEASTSDNDRLLIKKITNALNNNDINELRAIIKNLKDNNYTLYIKFNIPETDNLIDQIVDAINNNKKDMLNLIFNTPNIIIDRYTVNSILDFLTLGITMTKDKRDKLEYYLNLLYTEASISDNDRLLIKKIIDALNNDNINELRTIIKSLKDDNYTLYIKFNIPETDDLIDQIVDAINNNKNDILNLIFNTSNIIIDKYVIHSILDFLVSSITPYKLIHKSIIEKILKYKTTDLSIYDYDIIKNAILNNKLEIAEMLIEHKSVEPDKLRKVLEFEMQARPHDILSKKIKRFIQNI